MGFPSAILVVPFNNMEEVISAMNNKEIAGALLDMYAAATKKNMFDGGDIQLNRLIEYPTGYGFVLSGNMAKAAPLLRQALASKKTQISQTIEENTDSISQVSVTATSRLILCSHCTTMLIYQRQSSSSLDINETKNVHVAKYLSLLERKNCVFHCVKY